MKKYLDTKGFKLEYELKVSAKTRRVKISIFPDGRVLVTRPKFLYFTKIESFLLKNYDWIISSIEKSKNKNSIPYDSYLSSKDKALKLIIKRLEYFNSFYGFKYDNVRIRNQKTRWGSCSKNLNLNFNYKIYFLPKELVDYIVVHELCHLREFNHSASFWSLVSLKIPNYLELRKELRKINIY